MHLLQCISHAVCGCAQNQLFLHRVKLKLTCLFVFVDIRKCPSFMYVLILFKGNTGCLDVLATEFDPFLIVIQS